MNSSVSASDREFQALFESHSLPASEFDHRAHLRLAYIYLAEYGTEAAYRQMRSALHGYLEFLGVDVARYHETLTRSWILAVRHFMEKTPGTESADALIAQHPEMLDSSIMLTHYSAERLFSDAARAGLVAPDLDPIPEYDDKPD